MEKLLSCSVPRSFVNTRVCLYRVHAGRVLKMFSVAHLGYAGLLPLSSGILCGGRRINLRSGWRSRFCPKVIWNVIWNVRLVFSPSLISKTNVPNFAFVSVAYLCIMFYAINDMTFSTFAYPGFSAYPGSAKFILFRRRATEVTKFRILPTTLH